MSLQVRKSSVIESRKPMTRNILECLREYFLDPEIHELCVHSVRSLCLFRKQDSLSEASPFEDRVQMIRSCQEFALSQGQRLDAYSPSAGGYIEECKLRWHCLIPPASYDGAIFSLRRHSFVELEIENFLIQKSDEHLLTEIFENPSNHILFCGPTGSGKTSLLCAFLKKYARDQRVILIEEHAELPLLSERWLHLVSRKKDIEGQGEVKLSFLIEESLRLRPDRIVLGEIRNTDALVFFESILLGHKGSLSTIHASRLGGVRKRIEALLSLRGGTAKELWSSIKGIDNLWCVFLERGSPPSIVGIEKI